MRMVSVQPLDRPLDETAPNILCIDDDPDVVQAIGLLLSNYEVNVFTNFCGRLGLQDVFDKTPDLIITDVRMSHGDGEQLIDRIKQNTRTAHIPVIVLTGQRAAQLPGRLRNLGAAAILQKPVHYQTLLEEIQKHVTLNELNWTAREAIEG